VGGSLAPPAASLGGTARQAARPGRPTPRADVDGRGGSSVADISLTGTDWVERIAWFGEER
jgi:hypothetical protein